MFTYILTSLRSRSPTTARPALLRCRLNRSCRRGKAHVFGRAGWIEVDAEPAPVPAYLPAWRILSVMDLHGYTPTVEAIIDSLPANAKKVAKRQLAGSNIERNHALVLAAQQALGLTDAQVDDLFREADALV